MKICLAGTGAMGAIHVKALAKMSDVEVVSINARTEESGKAFAAEWNIPFQSANLEQCIDRPGVDAVILTTPSHMHAEQTLLALSKGKHVQVEIPMSLNLPDAERMLDAAKKSGKVCMVTHTRRFSSPHREIRRRIRDGSFHLHHMVVETLFLPAHEPQHARSAAVVGRQPAMASTGCHWSISRTGTSTNRASRCGARRAPITPPSASRWT